MYYSSKMLGDILDILNGNMVECTGDGNYSIFLESKHNERDTIKICKDFFVDLENMLISDDFIQIQNYILNFDTDEVKYVYPWILDNWDNRSFMHSYFKRVFFYEENLSKIVRILFFHIFAIFNIEVNKILKNRVNNKFLTRIGCKKGSCKITRIDINGHIKQDKLIGSVVHQAAHQASGK